MQNRNKTLVQSFEYHNLTGVLGLIQLFNHLIIESDPFSLGRFRLISILYYL